MHACMLNVVRLLVVGMFAPCVLRYAQSFRLRAPLPIAVDHPGVRLRNSLFLLLSAASPATSVRPLLDTGPIVRRCWLLLLASLQCAP